MREKPEEAGMACPVCPKSYKDARFVATLLQSRLYGANVDLEGRGALKGCVWGLASM